MMESITTSTTCRICGRPLFNPRSVARGFGPVCWAKMSLEDQMNEAVRTGIIQYWSRKLNEAK